MRTPAAATLVLGLFCLACRSAAPASAPVPALRPAAEDPLVAAAVRRLTGHLSREEAVRLAAIRGIHEGRGSIISTFRESGLLADSAEWIVAGPPERLPFAGTWRGIEGVAEFQRRLVQTMRYDTVTVREYLVSGDQVAAIFYGAGVARASGRPFRGKIVRLYTFAGQKVVRVRNYFDSAAYVAALHGVP